MQAATMTEPPGEQITGERETDLSTKGAQERYLVRSLGITYPQAKALIRAYVLDQRDADARHAAREEFRAWFARRGDLLIVRGKKQHAWRVAS